MSATDRPQTLGEEIANAISHGVGLLASVVALPVLLAATIARGDPAMVAASSIFAVSLILLYGAKFAPRF